MNKEKIKLFKSRNFGETIGVAFDLLGQNFSFISRCFLVFVMPFLVFSLLTFVLGVVATLRRQTMIYSGSHSSSMMETVGIIVGYFAYIFTFFVQSVVMHEVIIAYESSDDPSQLRVSHVWAMIKADTAQIIGSFIFLLLLIFPVAFASAAIIGVGAMISSSAGGFAVLVAYAGMIYLQICLSNYLMLRLRSEYGAFTSLKKSISITFGNWRWWKTFGVTLVMSIITSGFYTFSFWPFSLLLYLLVNHFRPLLSTQHAQDIAYVVVTVAVIYAGIVIAYFCNLIVIGASVNYYSLIEDSEHVGLTMNIEQIGIKDEAKKMQEGEY